MSEWMAGVGNHLWQTTAFAVVVWGLTLLLRKNQARVRYGLWVAASVKFLLPFSLLIVLGGMLPRPQRMVAAPAVYSTMDEVALPFDGALLPLNSVALTHVSEARHGAPGFVVALGVVWGCGVVMVLAVWASRWRRVWKTLRRAEMVEQGREFDLLQQVQRAMGGPARVSLRLSRELMEPGIFGILRPVLIWPQRLSDRLDDEHIEAILIHELAHVRRRDNLTAAVHMLVEALFWFHPAVWWMERRLVEERERACDEAVVAMGSKPGVYADSLLKAVRFCVESPLTCVAGITGADLSKRVRGIMTLRLERLGVGRKVALAAFGLAVVGVPILLGQGKPAQRMLLAAVDAAPKPFRAAAHAMMPLEETPATGELAEVQADMSGAAMRDLTADAAAGPAFEVASIRPSPTPASDNGSMGVSVTPSGRVRILRETVQSLVYFSYLPHVGTGLVQGGTDWTNKQEYDINAQVGDNEAATWVKLSDAQRTDRVRLMLRRLLAERFQVKMHSETQVQPVFALVQTKGGAKLKVVDAPPLNADQEAIEAWEKTENWTAENAPPGTFLMTGNTWTGRALPISQLLTEIAGNAHVDRLVVDETGLKGSYDFTFKPSYEKDAPILLDQIEDQLGLRLEPKKLPVKIYVIDSAEKPSVDGAEVPAPDAEVSPSANKAAAYVPTMTFDVASVRVVSETNFRVPMGGGWTPHSTHVQWTFTIGNILNMAYGVNSFQLTGVPNWTTVFAIEAKGDAEADAKMAALPIDEQRMEQQHMLQALLEERFKLKTHLETREGDTYDLVVAKGGPKLGAAGSSPPSAEELKNFGDHPVPSLRQKGDHGRLDWVGNACPMGDLASIMGAMFGRPVADKTGLAGKYDFVLKYKGRWDSDRNADDMDPTPPLDRALQEELGLKVEAAKGQVKVLVIDHIERPSAN